MVGFAVDILRCVIRLCVGHVLSIGWVQGDIKEVDNFLIGFDRYFETIFFEDGAEVFFYHV